MRWRRWRRWARLLALEAAATLLLCEISVRALTRTNPENGMPMIGPYPMLPYRPTRAAVQGWLDHAAGRYVAPDPDLGWTVRPHGRSVDGLYEANGEGARAPGEVCYGERPAPGRLRMVTVGDSFTHGDGVGIEDTWQRQMERQRPELEVVNLGVPGYGTDQAFLRWRRDGAPLHPQVALLGIWPENICRNLNVVRFFLQPAGGFGFLSKPRFVLAGGRLEPVNSPVASGEPIIRAVTDPAGAPALRHEYWAIPDDVEPRSWERLRLARVVATVASLYRRRALRDRLYAGEDPTGIDVTAAIAEAFRADAIARGARPLVALFPMYDLLARYPGEDALPLARALRARGLETIDLGPPMAREVSRRGRDCCFLADGHLSPEGHRLVAGWLLERFPWPAVRTASR